MLSIVIPTLQKDIKVLNLLLSEIEECSCVDEIILINNCNKDFKHNYKKLTVFNSKENLYVNPAWNLGVKLSKNKYIGIINDDLIFPKNFLEQVFVFLVNNNSIGYIGLNTIEKTDPNDFADYPNDSKLNFKEIKERCLCWGSSIFFKKDTYTYIPEEMKIWCGDDFLFYEAINKKLINYCIKNSNIKHLHSFTSDLAEFDEIKKNDQKNYKKINPKYMVEKKLNFFEKIFSIKNTANKSHKIITIFGIKIKINIINRNLICAKKYNKIKNFPNKMVCIFASYTKTGLLDKNLIKYLQEIRRYCDSIIFISDSLINPKELKKIEDIVDIYEFCRHCEYDFGSYKRGYKILDNLNLLDKIDNILFCNDSVKFVGITLKEVFEKSQNKDFYGFTQHAYGYIKDTNGEYIWGFTPHIQTYFFILSKKIFRANFFQEFITRIKQQKNKIEIIEKYEEGLSKIICNNGYQMYSYYEPTSEDIDQCAIYLHPNFKEKILQKKRIYKVR